MTRKPTANRRRKLLRNRGDRLAALSPIHSAMRLRITDNPRVASILDGIQKMRAYSAGIWRRYAIEARQLRSRYVADGMPIGLGGAPRPVGRRGGGASGAVRPLFLSHAFSRRGFCSGRQRQACGCRSRGLVTVIYGVEQRPEKPIALRCPDLHLGPGSAVLGHAWGAAKAAS